MLIGLSINVLRYVLIIFIYLIYFSKCVLDSLKKLKLEKKLLNFNQSNLNSSLLLMNLNQ